MGLIQAVTGSIVDLRSRVGRLAGAAAGSRKANLARVIDGIAAKLS